MIRRRLFLSAAAVGASLSVAACGGGSSDPTPTPTSTTTSSPTPTPTTSPTYPAFPLSTATEFFTINASTNYSGNLATGPVTLGAAGTEARSDRVRLAVSNDTSTGTFVVRESSEEARYTSTNLSVAPDTTKTEFVYRTDDAATAGKFSQTEFLNNIIPSKVTTDAGLALTRTSYAGWWRGDSTSGQKRVTYTVYGYPTVAGDIPTTGSASYTARLAGRAVQVNGGGTGALIKLEGTVTVNVNFATGLVNFSVNLTGFDVASAVPYNFGTFTGTGAIAPGALQFSGSFDGSSPLPGTIAGGFFGSRGEQIGITFALLGTTGGLDTRAVGSIVGKKN